MNNKVSKKRNDPAITDEPVQTRSGESPGIKPRPEIQAIVKEIEREGAAG